MLPAISVIIPFTEDHNMLRSSIEAYQQLDYPNKLCELILINNGGNTLAGLEDLSNKDGVRLVSVDRKNAYAARNMGAQIAKGELILFTDSDCVVDREWAKRVVVSFKDDTIAAVFGKVLAYKPQTPLEVFGNRYVFNRAQRPFEYIIGGNCAIRRSMFKKLGGFDERFNSGADIDFSIRLRQCGFRIQYEPRAIVYHKHRENMRQLFKQYKKYGAGWMLLKKKWGGRLKVYSNFRRILVTLTYLFISIFDLLSYSFGPQIIERKAWKLRHLYLAIMNAALFVGYFQAKVCKAVKNVEYD